MGAYGPLFRFSHSDRSDRALAYSAAVKSFAHLPRAEKLNLVVVIGAATAVLIKVSTSGPVVGDSFPFVFWVALTLVASFVQVRLPSDVRVSVNTAPLIAAVFDS